MDSAVLNKCKLEIKEPHYCSEKELLSFHQLVEKGGKVMLLGLFGRIKNCELLAFCYLGNKLIATSSIKKPNEDYVNGIIFKSKLDRKFENLNFEIGYSFTEEKFRRNGISKELKKELLRKMQSRNGIIFSTTAIKSSQNFLKENGFKKYGKPYDGDNDKSITFEKKWRKYILDDVRIKYYLYC
tara:strand:- start:3713 stop:4264 length:552 start_codon:yes stop_codon:yes gene_type:complete